MIFDVDSLLIFLISGTSYLAPYILLIGLLPRSLGQKYRVGTISSTFPNKYLPPAFSVAVTADDTINIAAIPESV